MRVLPRDGQQQRDARPSTGTRSSRRPGSRAGSSGSGATTASSSSCPTGRSATPTAATSATSRTTASFCHRRAHVPGPGAEARRSSSIKQIASPVRVVSGADGGPSRGRRAREPPGLPRPRLAPRVVGGRGRRRRSARGATCPCRRSPRAPRPRSRSPGSCSPALAQGDASPHGPRSRLAAASAVGAGRLRGRLGHRSTMGRPRPVSADEPGLAGRRRARRRGPAPSTPLLAAPPELALWRAPTDNDRIGGMAGRLDGLGARRPEPPPRRHRAEAARRPSSARPGGPPSGIEIRARADAGSRWPAAGPGRRSGSSSRTSSRDLAAGRDRARDGRRASRSATWFGRGPHESYPDRKRGARVGRWASTVTDLLVPTSGRRRTAAGPTSAGSSSAVRAGGGLRLDVRPAAARSRRPTTGPRTSRRADPRRRRSSPAARDDRPPRRRPSRPRHRELRAGHAAASTSSGPAPTSGAGRSGLRSRRRVDDRVGRRRPPVPPRERPPRATSSRSTRTARSGSSISARRSRPAARTATWRRGRSSGFANRLGDPVALEYPTPGSGDYRVPALVVEQPDGSTVLELAYRDAPDPRRASRRSPGLPATYAEADDEAETLEVDLADAPTGLVVTLSVHDLPRRRRRSPGAPGIRNDGATPAPADDAR